MKYLLLLMLLPDGYFVDNWHYKGYVFAPDHEVLLSVDGSNERFLPNKQDIELAEDILDDDLESLNTEKGMLNQHGDCPVIHKKLRRYYRQYFGFINNEGNRILMVNMIHKQHSDFESLKVYKSHFDGCSHYWSVKINLTTKTLYGLQVNGSG